MTVDAALLSAGPLRPAVLTGHALEKGQTERRRPSVCPGKDPSFS